MVKEKCEALLEEVNKYNPKATIVAATKCIPPHIINEIKDYGIINIGENKVAEFLEKEQFIDTGFVHHFIGHLQTNKVKKIAGKVSLIHSVDSLKLLAEINKCSVAPQDVLLEVNISGETQKYGFSKEQVFEALYECSNFKKIKVRGLMVMAPFFSNELFIRSLFANAHELFLSCGNNKIDNVSMDYLSMGMSGDYVYALKEGANMIRVGTALFGRRI